MTRNTGIDVIKPKYVE